VGSIANGPDIHDLERVRTRRLEENDFRFRSHQPGDGLANLRIEILDLDTQARQGSVAETTGGVIDRIHHETVVTARQVGEQRDRDGCEP